MGYLIIVFQAFSETGLTTTTKFWQIWSMKQDKYLHDLKEHIKVLLSFFFVI